MNNSRTFIFYSCFKTKEKKTKFTNYYFEVKGSKNFKKTKV